MPKILKGAEYRHEPVLVKGRRAGEFAPAHFEGEATEGLSSDSETPMVGPAELDAATVAEAEKIVADAKERAAEITREAMVRGYAEGHAEGLRVAEEQSRGHLERLAELAKRAVIDRESMVRSAEQELATLALEIASKVLRREVTSDPSLVLTMVESALEKVGSTDSVRILVHPEGADLVREKWSELRGAVAFGSNWEIVADDGMERGGCVIETKSGLVDSRIEAQLSEIVSAFEVGQ